jgi:hypothetical protein
MFHKPLPVFVCAIAALVAMAAAGGPAAAQSNPKCDPVDPVSDVGWSVVPSLETVGKADGAPYQAGAGGDWFIDRATRCFRSATITTRSEFSMRSYTLSRQSARNGSKSASARPPAAACRSSPMRDLARRFNPHPPRALFKPTVLV